MLMDQPWEIERQAVIEKIINPFLENVISYLINSQNQQFLSPYKLICLGNELNAI